MLEMRLRMRVRMRVRMRAVGAHYLRTRIYNARERRA
jgi:hypothetical protein